MRVPLIIAGASITPAQSMTRAFSYVTDIAPTVLELGGVSGPGQRYGGRTVEPITGRSLVPLIEGRVDRVYAPQEAIGYELAGNAALFQADYKIVINRGPVGDNQWHLYNIATDPGETDDLARRMPRRLQTMLALYDDYVAQNNVLPVATQYSQERQLGINALQVVAGPQILVFLFTLMLVLPFYFAYRNARR